MGQSIAGPRPAERPIRHDPAMNRLRLDRATSRLRLDLATSRRRPLDRPAVLRPAGWVAPGFRVAVRSRNGSPPASCPMPHRHLTVRRCRVLRPRNRRRPAGPHGGARRRSGLAVAGTPALGTGRSRARVRGMGPHQRSIRGSRHAARSRRVSGPSPVPMPRRDPPASAGEVVTIHRGHGRATVDRARRTPVPCRSG
jgi:hypothetical protein